MWQDYSNLKYQEFSLNGSNVTSITNVTTIEPNLNFQYFSSAYLSDGRLIMAFGNDYPSIENNYFGLFRYHLFYDKWGRHSS